MTWMSGSACTGPVDELGINSAMFASEHAGGMAPIPGWVRQMLPLMQVTFAAIDVLLALNSLLPAAAGMTCNCALNSPSILCLTLLSPTCMHILARCS